MSFLESDMGYSRGLLTVTFPCLNADFAAIDDISVLRPEKRYCLVDGRHRFTAMHELIEKQSNASWNFTIVFCVSHIVWKYGRLLSSSEVLFCNQRTKKLTCIVLNDNRFVATILQLLEYAKTVKLDYDIPFTRVSAKCIATYLLKPGFLLRAQLSNYRRIVCVAKPFRMNADALTFMGQDKGAALGIRNVDDNNLFAAAKQFNVPLLRAAAHFVSNPAPLKVDFRAKAF